MPFHFPLDAVLHFRQSLEHQQELRLRAANQQVAAVRKLIDLIDERVRLSRIGLSQALVLGTASAEMGFALASRASLHRKREDLERELNRRKGLRDQQQQIFEQARRERETFATLRDRQLHAYNRNEARLEQRQLDDLFLLRRSYLRRG